MTEAEWLSSTDPTPMLEFLRGKASDRKLRLFAVACCRRAWHLLEDRRLRRAITTAEMYADGMCSSARAQAAARGAKRAGDERRYQGSEIVGDWFAVQAAEGFGTEFNPRMIADHVCTSMGEIAAHQFLQEVHQSSGDAAYEAAFRDKRDSVAARIADSAEKQLQSSYIRCLFNPFHPIPLNPTWQTSTVLALAQGIYQDRAFDRLPILADALMDSGCDNPDLLNHLRSEGPHTRGCWAIDLLLNRE